MEMIAIGKTYVLALSILLAAFGQICAQVKGPPPDWSEGDKLTKVALNGVWWVKIPFRFESDGASIATIRRELPWSSPYVAFDEQGIIYQRTLTGPQSRNAIGVWLLQDDRLEISVSNMSLELDYYMVQPDKIVVAGNCTIGKLSFAVAGVLLQLQPGYPVQMEE
jgi:hypothetical protein